MPDFGCELSIRSSDIVRYLEAIAVPPDFQQMTNWNLLPRIVDNRLN